MKSLASAVLAISIVFPSLAIIFAGLRFAARRARSVAPQADDWMIVVTVILCIGLGINTIVGVGLELIGQPPETLGLERSFDLEKVVYGDSFLCFASLATVKVSVLLFYKRVFATVRFRTAANTMIGVVIAWFIASFLCLLLSQDPIQSHWDPFVPYRYRLDFRAFLLTHASLDLVFDIAILCFPIPVIKQLHMKRSRKIGLVGLFWLGGFCVIAEAVRIYYFNLFLTDGSKRFANGVETSFAPAIANVLIWSRIEPCISVVAACLPTLGPLVRGGRDPRSLVNSIRSIFSVHSDSSRSNGYRLTSQPPGRKFAATASRDTDEEQLTTTYVGDGTNHIETIVEGGDEHGTMGQEARGIMVHKTFAAQ